MSDEHDTTALAERAPSALHPMVAEVLRQHPTPEALQQLMAMQERWEDRRAEQAYTRALVALRQSLPPWLERDAVVDYTSSKGRTHYRHTSLAAGMETIHPHLIEHGFAAQWKVERKGTDVEVTCILRHQDGHSEKTTLHAPPDTSGNKSAPQAIASTQTLLQRYTLLGLLGLATKDQTEPGDRPPHNEPGAIDTAANRKLALEIVRAGRRREDAEALVGRAVKDWTGADMETIRAWMSPADLIPVGPNKGKPLSTLDDAGLAKAIAWAEEHHESAFLDALHAEAERRASKGVGE